MKIFHKLRMEMLKNKRITNYLVYALGEIVLVVLGILIALYLNNWSKENQLREVNVGLQNRVLLQLDKDLLEINNFSDELDSLNNIYLKTLGRSYDTQKIKKAGILSTILFDVKDLGLVQQNINWIDAADLDASKASEELIKLSNIYKFYFKNIDDLEKVIYQKFTDNLEFLEATQPWYTSLITDFTCENECINFLLNNDEHKARIASLRFLYIQGYGSMVRSFYQDLQRSRDGLKQAMKQEA